MTTNTLSKQRKKQEPAVLAELDQRLRRLNSLQMGTQEWHYLMKLMMRIILYCNSYVLCPQQKGEDINEPMLFLWCRWAKWLKKVYVFGISRPSYLRLYIIVNPVRSIYGIHYLVTLTYPVFWLRRLHIIDGMLLCYILMFYCFSCCCRTQVIDFQEKSDLVYLLLILPDRTWQK